MGLSARQLEQLAPLLEGDHPDATGNINMFCPYHGDSKRSASLHVEKEVWNCKGCGQAGTVRDLLSDRDEWQLVAPESQRRSKGRVGKVPLPSEGTVGGWASALQHEVGCLAEFKQRRGLKNEIIKRYEIGWDQSHNCFTIPVRDAIGEIINVRSYQLDPQDERRKIWSVQGHGSPALFPIDQLSANAIVVCEGELDALMLIQNGIPAITRTGTADTWNIAWSPLFKGKRVFVCHDMDTKGQHANNVITAALRKHASSITVVTLPYEVTTKHGKDITDFFKDGATKSDFLERIKVGKRIQGPRRNESEITTEEEPVEQPITVMDSFDATLVHRSISMHVTITGKRIPSYLLPEIIQFSCNMDAGDKCDSCALKMRGPGGTDKSKEGSSKIAHYQYEVAPSDEVILKMVEVDDKKVQAGLWKAAGLVKCNKWEADVLQHRTVEELYVRPSIESRTSGDPDFTHRKVISVGSHDLTANQTVRLVGTIRPNPKNQTNEFQAWQVDRPPSTLDSYAVTAESKERLAVFRTEPGQNPLERAYEIAEELAATVTMVQGRPELHVFMDLVLHSALEFNFGNDGVGRGWLDGLIFGDPRTGKSKVAEELIRHYGMGEMISCESATFAGVVGGLDRMGDGKWVVKWGSIPVNDRRAVVLDEVSGLLPEQIAQMSSIRSSGIAELTKIQTESANARTRLIWLGNPRNGERYTYGINALAPLIGNPEDIARFDMAMGVFSEEVSAETINTQGIMRKASIEQESFRELLMWAWTRRASDIRWAPTAVKLCLATAVQLGADYKDVPPLIQAANVRLKLARIATAVAMRTYSSDSTGHLCLVRKEHVEAAENFLHNIYSNPRFGYGSVSRQAVKDKEETTSNLGEIVGYVHSYGNKTPGNQPGPLERFFREYPTFNRSQIEMALNITREQSQEIFARLYELRAVHLHGGQGVRVDDLVLAEIRRKYE